MKLLSLTVTALVTLLLLILLGCGWNNAARVSQSKDSTPQMSPDGEQYVVLSALIKDMYINDDVRLLVIQHQYPCPTVSEPNEVPDQKVEEMRQHMEDDAFQRMPELSRETIDDFHSHAKECQPLAKQLDVPINYVLVGPKELELLFPKGEFDRAWSRFYKKYPGSSGIISLSNVGFNRDLTQAVVSTGRGCGGLCGEGYFVLLTKAQNVWTVKTKVNTWVS